MTALAAGTRIDSGAMRLERVDRTTSLRSPLRSTC